MPPAPHSRPPLLLLALLTLGVAGLIGGYFALRVRQMGKLALQDRVRSLDGFKVQMDQDQEWEYEPLSLKGESYTMAWRFHPTWTLASGPAVYIFDQEGALVDWVLDEGESPEWHGRWGAFGTSHLRSK